MTFVAAPAVLESLIGRAVLVVEDNGFLCCVIEEALHEAGCTIVGPFTRLPEAMAAVPAANIDVAVLGMNVRGELVSPLADQLAQRGVPFLLTSAYRSDDLPLQLQSAMQLRKPYTDDALLERLALLIASKERNN